MVARDNFGDFMVGRTLVFPGLFKVMEAEIMGVFEALVWARDLGFTDIVIEMDSKNVQEALHKELHTIQFLGVLFSPVLSLEIYFRVVSSLMFLVLPMRWHIILLGPRDLIQVPILGLSLLFLWIAFSMIFVLIANK
ncbi:hypothetical protein ACS0TY_010340 [Phlomoides rotata]